MRFFTLSAAIAALMAIATVQASTADQAHDGKQAPPTGNNSTAPAPIPLTTAQLTQCITQIVDKEAKVCDLTQLDGLTFPEKKDKKDDVRPPPVNVNDRVLDLDALTTLVSKATDKLNNNGKTVDVDSVQKGVADLVKDLPAGQVNSSSLNKRADKESATSGDNKNTKEILADSGLSLDQVKSLVGKALTDLKVNPPVAKDLKPKVKKSICKTLTKHHIKCDKILPILAKEGRLA